MYAYGRVRHCLTVTSALCVKGLTSRPTSRAITRVCKSESERQHFEHKLSQYSLDRWLHAAHSYSDLITFTISWAIVVYFHCNICHSSFCSSWFLSSGFARFDASSLNGVVVNFYNPWCIIVWYTFLQNFVNFCRFIQKFYDNSLIMKHSIENCVISGRDA